MIFAFLFITVLTVLSAGSVKEEVRPPVKIVAPFGKCEEFTHDKGSNKYVAEIKYCGGRR